MWADEDVVRHIGGQTRDRQDSWLTLLRHNGLWPTLGYGTWTVRERRTGDYVGDAGFADYMRGMTPDISGTPEAGWVFKRDHWGKGYASEAMIAALSWLDEYVPGRSTCIIEPDHAASIRVAQKLGYRDFDSSDYKGTPMLIFERYSPDTEKS